MDHWKATPLCDSSLPKQPRTVKSLVQDAKESPAKRGYTSANFEPHLDYRNEVMGSFSNYRAGDGNPMDYFLNEKAENAKKRKVALKQKDAAKSALRNRVWMAYELGEALESPGCTEEARKAHVDAQKMVELILATVKRREAELIALDEEEKAIDDALESLKTC